MSLKIIYLDSFHHLVQVLILRFIFMCPIIPDGIVKIESAIRQPKYKIKGNADKHGNLFCSYNFKSVSDDTIRKSDTSWTWEQIYKSLDKEKEIKRFKS